MAAPKKRKTFFGIQLAVSLACGIPFLDLKTTQTKVMYLNLEMTEEMIWERIMDIATSIHAPIEVLRKNLWIVTDHELRFDSDESQKSIIDEVRKNEIKIVFIDPLQQAIDGSDSNEKDLRLFIRRVNRIIKKTDVSFFIIHHTAKVTKSNEPVFAGRGHSILPGWVDSVLLLKDEQLVATSRATSIDPINISFDYPVWKAVNWGTEVERVRFEILRHIGATRRKKMMRLTLQGKIECSEWAFKEALKEMKTQGMLKIRPIKNSHYNQKMVVLVE